MSMDVFLTILQLPRQELWDRIEQELQENPVLEVNPSADAESVDANPLAILGLPLQTLRDRIDEELFDIIVDYSQVGEPEIRVPEGEVTRLVINHRYVEMLAEPATEPVVREYLRRVIKRAQGLQEALEQRRATLQKVAAAIFRQQQGFLEHGPNHCVPLCAEQVSHATELPVATVIRAVMNKQVRTPHGVVSLDCFITWLPSSSDN